jgi:hypothetical protein
MALDALANKNRGCKDWKGVLEDLGDDGRVLTN